MKRADKNMRLLLILLSCALIMLGVSYASVPLYRLFCSATGFGGTTQRVVVGPSLTPPPSEARAVAAPQIVDRKITVSFDGNVDSALPWDFGPDVKSVTLRLGEVTTIMYHAHNRGQDAVVGTATFNVQPDKIGSYFNKIQCFCFTKQLLKAGESIELPVQFYIDPDLAKDHQADDVQNVTLSYTFFRAKDQSQARSLSINLKHKPSATPQN